MKSYKQINPFLESWQRAKAFPLETIMGLNYDKMWEAKACSVTSGEDFWRFLQNWTRLNWEIILMINFQRVLFETAEEISISNFILLLSHLFLNKMNENFHRNDKLFINIAFVLEKMFLSHTATSSFSSHEKGSSCRKLQDSRDNVFCFIYVGRENTNSRPVSVLFMDELKYWHSIFGNLYERRKSFRIPCDVSENSIALSNNLLHGNVGSILLWKLKPESTCYENWDNHANYQSFDLLKFKLIVKL